MVDPTTLSIQPPVAEAQESTQHSKSATNTPLPPSPNLASFPALPSIADPDYRVSRHHRRPSRAERYEGLVESARKMLKGVENSEEGAASGGQAEEIDAILKGGDWILCVKNLLLVVDGMVSLWFTFGLCVVFGWSMWGSRTSRTHFALFDLEVASISSLSFESVPSKGRGYLRMCHSVMVFTLVERCRNVRANVRAPHNASRGAIFHAKKYSILLDQTNKL